MTETPTQPPIQATNSSATISIGDALNVGWNGFKRKIPLFLSIGAVFLVIQVLTSVLGQSAFFNQGTGMFILQLVSNVAGMILGMGWLFIAVKIARGEDVQFSDVFSRTPLLVKYLLATIALGILIGIGFLLLIIPGIYLALRYSFVPYLIIDKNLGIFDAFKKSEQMTQGIKMQLLFYFIVISLINVIGAMMLGIGLIVTIPVSAVASASIYLKLLSKIESVTTPTIPPLEPSVGH